MKTTFVTRYTGKAGYLPQVNSKNSALAHSNTLDGLSGLGTDITVIDNKYGKWTFMTQGIIVATIMEEIIK